MFVGDLHDACPDGPGQLWVTENRVDVRWHAVHAIADLRVGRERLHRIVAGDVWCEGMLADRAVRVLHLRQGTEVFRMVRNDVPVQRYLDLERRAVAVAWHRFALRPAVGIVGIRPGAVDVRIERPAGMDVQVSEVHVPERIPRDRCFLVGNARRRRGGSGCTRPGLPVGARVWFGCTATVCQ